jgi:acetylornithine deacetylase/succinyl-diaminopimelate desuccinylase-like protein
VSEASSSVRHLRDYVAIPSVNPMGRDDVPAEQALEARYAEHLREQLRALSLDAELVGDAARPSVVAEARAGAGAETVLVASHLDTVPVDGMEIPPFEPAVREGRLYGRGACDTKAGMAALVAALERVLSRGRLRRSVVVVGEADEEYGSAGARDVLRHLGERKPDWALATEPTELRIVNRHKGIACARLVARGRACHASDPHAGRSAILALARAVLALDAHAAELDRRTHPGLGPATLNVGIVGGGRAFNVVPDHAWLWMDRRLLPGENADSVRTELEETLAEAGLDGVEVESCEMRKGALATPEDHPSIAACRAALAAASQPPSALAPAGFGADAGLFAEEGGIPGVVMGPGSIARAHTAAEYVELDQLEAMTAFFVALLEGAQQPRTGQRGRTERGR